MFHLLVKDMVGAELGFGLPLSVTSICSRIVFDSPPVGFKGNRFHYWSTFFPGGETANGSFRGWKTPVFDWEARRKPAERMSLFEDEAMRVDQLGMSLVEGKPTHAEDPVLCCHFCPEFFTFEELASFLMEKQLIPS